MLILYTETIVNRKIQMFFFSIIKSLSFNFNIYFLYRTMNVYWFTMKFVCLFFFFEYVECFTSPLGIPIFNFLVTNWIFDLASSLSMKVGKGIQSKIYQYISK